MFRSGILAMLAVLCVTLRCNGIAAASVPKAMVRSVVKLTANVDAAKSKGAVQLDYDTDDDDFVAALAANSPASVVVADAAGFRVTLDAENCIDRSDEIACRSSDGLTTIEVARLDAGAPTPYRLKAKRKKIAASETGTATLQAPVTITLRRAGLVSRLLTSPNCLSAKPSRLACKTIFNRNHRNSAPSFQPGYKVWRHTPALASFEGYQIPPYDLGIGSLFESDLSRPDPQAIRGWASGVLVGSSPTDSGQSLSVELSTVSTTGNLTFDEPPTLDLESGTLAFLTTPGTYGTANIEATLRDDGGTGGGGSDTFVTNFSITVNSPPSALDGYYTGPRNSPCIPIDLGGSDPDGMWSASFRRIDSTTNGILIEFVPKPSNGTNAGPTLCYRPRLNFTGADYFSFEVFDAEGGFSSPPASGTIVVYAP